MAMENKEQDQNPQPKSEETNSMFFELGFTILVSLISIIVYSYALMFAWNDFAVPILNLKELSFSNALALLVLRYIIIGSTQSQTQTVFNKSNQKKV